MVLHVMDLTTFEIGDSIVRYSSWAGSKAQLNRKVGLALFLPFHVILRGDRALDFCYTYCRTSSYGTRAKLDIYKLLFFS